MLQTVAFMLLLVKLALLLVNVIIAKNAMIALRSIAIVLILARMLA